MDDRLQQLAQAPGTGAQAELSRLLRHTPLPSLLSHRVALVQALVACPDLHRALRFVWDRQDATATAQLFAWVAQARLHQSRTDGVPRQHRRWVSSPALAA